jgi:hypothetical protein
MGCVWMEHSISVIDIMIHNVYLSLQNVIIFFVLLMIYFSLMLVVIWDGIIWKVYKY